MTHTCLAVRRPTASNHPSLETMSCVRGKTRSADQRVLHPTKPRHRLQALGALYQASSQKTFSKRPSRASSTWSSPTHGHDMSMLSCLASQSRHNCSARSPEFPGPGTGIKCNILRLAQLLHRDVRSRPAPDVLAQSARLVYTLLKSANSTA